MKGKPKTAVALHYDPETEAAPRVVATGKGRVADAILEKAREAGVPVTEDPDLAHLLSEVPLSSTIPEPLFEVVAELFAFLWRAGRSR